MAKKTTKQTWPETIFVVKDGEGDEAFLIADDDIDGIDSDGPVAIYRLEEVGEVSTERHVNTKPVPEGLTR